MADKMLQTFAVTSHKSDCCQIGGIVIKNMFVYFLCLNVALCCENLCLNVPSVSPKYTNSTELSKYIWKLRDNNQDFNIKWTVISRARPYNNISKRCDLCLTEKLMIITAKPDRILNKRSELISKCRHENKFYLGNN